MKTGPIPWFAHPQFKVNFFRPISSALLALFIFAVSDPHWVNVAWGVPDQRTVFLTVHFAACWNGHFLRRLERLPMPERWWMLSAADAEHHYHRTGPDRLVLETVGGEMMATRLESMIRSRDAPIPVGYEVDLDGMRVRVLEVGRFGPTRVEFTFDRSLDDRSMVLMAVRDGRLQRVESPPVGTTLRLPSSW